MVGVADPIKGQMPLAFAVVKDAERIATTTVGRGKSGSDARPSTSSSARSRGRRACISSRCCRRRAPGKLLRRSIQALAEGRDPGDLTTIEDPTALEQIRAALQPQAVTKS